MTADEGDAVLRLRSERVTWREVEGEIIVLDRASASYFSANPSAALLWKTLADGSSRMQLIETLVSHYGIDEGLATTDVDAFIKACRDSDLLET